MAIGRLELISFTTSGSSVTSFAVDNVFSSSYTNYVVTVGVPTGSSTNTGNNITFLDSSGTEITSSNYDNVSERFNVNAAPSFFSGTGDARIEDLGQSNTHAGSHNNVVLNIFNPNKSSYTYVIAQSSAIDTVPNFEPSQVFGVLKTTDQCRGLSWNVNNTARPFSNVEIGVYGVSE
tara:strand:- start:84 stop:614 length:531 start_codon:yes stop_codon:yes gene_type:complete